MRRTLFLTPLVALIACGAVEVSGLTPAPPSPIVVGSVHVVPDGTGQSAVQVAAHAYNDTRTHLRLGTGPSCPLYVRMFPDSSGEGKIVAGVPPACPASAFTVDLAPGDSVVLTQLIPASEVSTLPPMIYGFNVGVVFDHGSVTVWAGSVRVPFSSATSAAPANER